MVPFLKFPLLLLDKLGINALFRLFNRDKAVILWYHGVCDDNFRLLKGYNERHIPKSLFRKHLKFLKEKGYVFATMSELADMIKNKKKIRKVVVLTFDDGFRNVVKNACPIMKEFNAKGCFYLVSSLIGTNKILWTDHVETVIRNCRKGEFQFIFKGKKIMYKLNTKRSYEKAMRDVKRRLRAIPDKERKKHLEQFSNKKISNVPREFLFANWKEIKGLDKRILEVGSHTKNHPNCTQLVLDNEFKEEMKAPKVKIEKMVGYRINHFNYPAGAYNNKIIKKVKKYRYKSAVTTVPGFNKSDADLYRLKRLPTSENFLLFKASVSGTGIILIRLGRAMGIVK